MPNGVNPKDLIGLTKPSLFVIPPAALLHMGRAMQNGAAKYGAFNWRQHPVLASIYLDAAMRHLLSWLDGEENARDSGVHHLGHAMACMAIVLDAAAVGCLKDDRPTPGAFADLIEAFTIRPAAPAEVGPSPDETRHPPAASRGSKIMAAKIGKTGYAGNAVGNKTSKGKTVPLAKGGHGMGPSGGAGMGLPKGAVGASPKGK